MKAKDSRFDGQFITGVHTTGIYCRPSCPARTPHPQNVSFFVTAAAAHQAGLRACKRCLPDAVPGSPEWNLRDDLAARVMRLIDDGVVDREGVDGLARRVGYTPRHLTRVLTAELGAGPQALARAHRAQSARVLLQSTELPLAQVVFASGFSSVRAFNETILAVYETSPSRLREQGRAGRRHSVAAAADTPVGHGVDSATAPSIDTAAPTIDPSSAGTCAAVPRPTHPLSSGPAQSSTTAPRAAPASDAISAHCTSGRVRLTLPARPPFDGTGVIDFLAARAVSGVEDVSDGTYRRSLLLPHGQVVIAVTDSSGGVVCTAQLENLADVSTLASRVRRLLDLDADSQAIDEVLSQVPELRARVKALPGIRMPGSTDPHEVVFRALVGQQISVKAARTVLGRLATELGDTVTVGSDAAITRLFPTAAQIAEHGREVLRGPARRVDTIIHTAEALASGEISLDVGTSHAQLLEQLTAVPGIGEWTAGYVAMRVLGAPDVLLDGDLAARAGAAKLGLPSGRRELRAWAERVSPWRSYLGMHLWRAAAG
ncbi:helix-turn-helix domain-containing protein [Subtercola sp. PAMC28395]|nr:helix-turn-helix domain-containing protein [Subtercola sp. PAMC28395]